MQHVTPQRYSFRTDNAALQAKHDKSISELAENVVNVAAYEHPVLIEGAQYRGIWLECGPLEGLCYAPIDIDTAVHNHRIFFTLQRDDGYIPCLIRTTMMSMAQIQSVVPIAATAWEVYQRTLDRGFLAEAYSACERWDSWLRTYRDTRGSGLCELFCEYDTGHDNSPRLHGLPKECPNGDAAICNEGHNLPWIAPDLSATLYGSRVALSAMANALGLAYAAEGWLKDAESTRKALIETCYDPIDASFYDVNSRGDFIRVRGDAMTRVLSEHVVDQYLFDVIFERQIGNLNAFWTSYPLPSIAADDPLFVGDFPSNSWGGAAQGLTALRAPRWLEHYGKYTAMTHMMRQWVSALLRDDGSNQQLNPFTGEFNHLKGPIGSYSPTLLVMIEYTAKLFGVMWHPQEIEWNVRMPEESTIVHHEITSPSSTLDIRNVSGEATISINDRELGHVTGICRVITDHQGNLKCAIGTQPAPSQISLTGFGRAPVTFTINPDEVRSLVTMA